MGETLISIAVSDGIGEDRLRACADKIRDAWPRDGAPRFETSDRETICDTDASAAVVLFAPDTQTLEALHLADRLQEAGLPALLLFADAQDEHRRIEQGGVIVEPEDADASHLASTLFALVERQGVVCSLGVELRAANMVQGGIQGEMDRLHEELNLAAVVQKEFIPRCLPDAPGFDTGVLFRPAGYVSGDIYDVTRLGDEHVSFMVADAMGHGVPAALMTMVISKSLRKIETSEGVTRVLPPGETLERLNTEMCKRHGASHRFATAVYGVLHLPTGLVTLAGAGHPPPMRIRHDGVEEIETEGPLLGVFAEAEYDQRSFVLEPGESLLIYSDGFEVAFPPPDADEKKLRLPTQTYVEHLIRLADRGENATLADAMESLGGLLGEQLGSLHQADDVTALAITRPAEAAVRARAA